MGLKGLKVNIGELENCRDTESNQEDSHVVDVVKEEE